MQHSESVITRLKEIASKLICPVVDGDIHLHSVLLNLESFALARFPQNVLSRGSGHHFKAVDVEFERELHKVNGGHYKDYFKILTNWDCLEKKIAFFFVNHTQ